VSDAIKTNIIVNDAELPVSGYVMLDQEIIKLTPKGQWRLCEDGKYHWSKTRIVAQEGPISLREAK
jgi:hypothetical protein